jgi:hypothetical protein
VEYRPSRFLLLRFSPVREDPFNLRGPFELSATPIAEFTLEKNLAFTILAEESLLLLEFLGHGYTVGPHFGFNQN